MKPLLEVDNLIVRFGTYQVLWGISLTVHEGEIVALLGPNGSGKSTVMNAISGLVRPAEGAIVFLGENLERLPAHQRPRRGLVHVLERHHVFTKLSVEENLIVGGLLHSPKERKHTMDEVMELFPVLRERRNQAAGTLSGGEQQMVAIGRGLMGRPRLLMLDEPTLGLSPLFQSQIKDTIREINRRGMTLLVIEQHVQDTLGYAHRGVVLESGRLAVAGTRDELLKSAKVREVFLGETHCEHRRPGDGKRAGYE